MMATEERNRTNFKVEIHPVMGQTTGSGIENWASAHPDLVTQLTESQLPLKSGKQKSYLLCHMKSLKGNK